METPIWKPLLDGEIRLLQLLDPVKLEFDLLNAGLAEAPKFAALSYTWEDPTPRHSLTISNCSIGVGENLYQALRHITDHALFVQRLFEKIYFWADAICINQSDEPEKSRQVRRMKEIYENSSRIYVWLGQLENESLTHPAAKLMQNIDNQWIKASKKAYPYRPWWWPKKPVDAGQIWVAAEQDSKRIGDKKAIGVSEPLNTDAWAGICALFELPWWTRTWVFQEATIPEPQTGRYLQIGIDLPADRPRSKVVFLSGPTAFTWFQFEHTHWAAASILSDSGNKLSILQAINKSFPRIDALRDIRTRKQSVDFLELLRIFRPTQCSDPRDKVYAAIGLAAAEARQQIVPTYDISPVEVYLQIVHFILKQPGHELDFLGYAMNVPSSRSDQQHVNNRLNALPSWVPNWSDEIVMHPFPKTLLVLGPEKRSMTPKIVQDNIIARQRVYNAGGKDMGRIVIEAGTLRLQGVEVDLVTDFFVLSGDDLDLDQVRKKVDEWARNAGYKYPTTSETFQQAYLRTITADVRHNIRGRVVERNFAIDFSLKRKDEAQLTASERERVAEQRIATNRFESMRGLCMTADGKLGFVPVTTRPGDTICTFVGGQTMYVLRKQVDRERTGKTYQYIGEAYIHGLMDGEVMEWVQKGTAKMTEFALI